MDPNTKSDRGASSSSAWIVSSAPRSRSAPYIYRKYDRFLWDDRYVVAADRVSPERDFTSADYAAVNYTAPDCNVNGRCPQLTYYQPTVPLPALQIRSNTPDRNRVFNGFELTGRKRYSDRWLVDASFAYNSAIDNWESPAAYEDPTNTVDKLNGLQYAPASAGSGIDNIYNNAKWLVKIAGSTPRRGTSTSRRSTTAGRATRSRSSCSRRRARTAAGSPICSIDPLGDRRLVNYHNVDFRVAKQVKFGSRKIDLSMDVFNLFNSDTVLARRRNQRATNANIFRAPARHCRAATRAGFRGRHQASARTARRARAQRRRTRPCRPTF